MADKDNCLKGAIGEQIFANHFLENRIFFSQPAYDLWGADFVVEWEGALHKVNVKTMTKKTCHKNHYYSVNFQRGSRGTKKYNISDVTYFGVVNTFYKRIWMVPNSDSLPQTLHYFGPLENRLVLRSNSFYWEKYRIK